MSQTTAIIVNYNTPEIISRAVNSIKNYVDCVVIVDNSDKTNPAYAECDSLIESTPKAYVKVIHTGENIGHGPALNIGIKDAQTDKIIVMDSDAVLIDPYVIVEMTEAIQPENVYGAGLVVDVNDAGTTVPNGQFPYLHPYFAMFWKYDFLKYSGFINHGAPWLRTMKEIKGKMQVVNIHDIQKKAWHEHRRTRTIAGKSWQKNWETA